MLTRLVLRNFKSFDDVDIELGETVVLVGPNNSGKTSALQALALWELGLRRWQEKKGTKGEGRAFACPEDAEDRSSCPAYDVLAATIEFYGANTFVYLDLRTAVHTDDFGDNLRFDLRPNLDY